MHNKPAEPTPQSHGQILLAVVAGLCFYFVFLGTSSAQGPAISPSYNPYPAYDSKEIIVAQLRSAPPKNYNFDRALLPDVLRFLAEEAGIAFFSTLEQSPGQGGGGRVSQLDSTLVTFSMRASPFVVLESIARANNIALTYENGLWIIRPINEKELIGRTYRLKYTPQERITFDAAAGGGGGGSGGSSVASASIPNLQRQQSQSIFKVEEPAIVEEIKNILKIPSGSLQGRVAKGEASVENFPPLPEVGGLLPNWSQEGAAEGKGEPTVTFNSDTNSIYIVATRQQHDWVEGFLAAADRPQALIGIEVKFFETTKDPRSDLGVNWSGITRDLRISASDITASPGGTIEYSNSTDRTRDQRAGTVRPGDSTYDFTDTTTENNSRVSFAAPYSAVLSVSDMTLAIQAFMQDNETTLVQYPRVLTVNNREVAISNAQNQPILGSSTQNQTSGSTQTTNTIEYLPIGTQLNILPKTMPDGSIFLNIAITISNRLRDEFLNTGAGVNPFPVTASRVYQAALQVDSGFTLAVGGLEEAFDELQRNGVPFFKDIPGLGELFKSSGRARRKRNLIVFITPTVIQDRATTTGISQTPESIVPVRGPIPRPPAFTPDGFLVGGVDALSEAIRWLDYQIRIYRQLNKEKNVDRATLKRLEGILNTAGMIQTQIDLLKASSPNRMDFLNGAEAQTAVAVTELVQLQKDIRKNIIY